MYRPSVLQDESPLGFAYISESCICNESVNNLDVNRNADLFFITFDANLQDFDVENRNKRYYDAQNVWQCIQTEKIQSLLRTGGWFGEFEHPIPILENDKFSPQRIRNVIPEKRAFKIMNPYLSGNKLKAKIQSAQGPVGEGFGKEVLAGWIPQFSARSIANMIMKNGKPYVQMKLLITYDAPWYPSHACAEATSAPKVTTRSFNESVEDDVMTESKDIFMPLKEILTEVGKTDVNAQVIMESFDLTEADLLGFDKSHKHLIVQESNNKLFVNIDPKTVNKVDDFFRSF